MPGTPITRSSSIDLGTNVVVKREGDLQGQRGSVVDKKQGWYKVQLPGTDGVRSFRWAELKEIEPPSPSRPSATHGEVESTPSPKLSASSESSAAEAGLSAGVVAAAQGPTSAEPPASGLPPRHPSSTVPIAAARSEVVITQRATGGVRASPKKTNDGSTPAVAAAPTLGGQEQRSSDMAAKRGVDREEAADGEETETDTEPEELEEESLEGKETEPGEFDECQNGGMEAGDIGKEQGGEEERDQGQDGAVEEEGQEDAIEETEDEEDEDIDAMIQLAAAAAREHHTSALATSSHGGGRGSAKSVRATAVQARHPPSSGGAEVSSAARKRPRVSGTAPRALDSGLSSSKYLTYGGTSKKGGRLTAAVSSGAVDGGKAAKLMAGSALYSGRDRAMLLERTKAPKDTSAGKGWFNMEQAEMTPELKRDLQVIRMRNYVDPKRFYKASDKVSKFLQVGTVKEGPAEYFSSRLTNKERKKTLVDELLVADDAFRAYSKNQYGSIQSRKRAGGKAAYNDQKRKRKGGAKWKP